MSPEVFGGVQCLLRRRADGKNVVQNGDRLVNVTPFDDVGRQESYDVAGRAVEQQPFDLSRVYDPGAGLIEFKADHQSLAARSHNDVVLHGQLAEASGEVGAVFLDHRQQFVHDVQELQRRARR